MRILCVSCCLIRRVTWGNVEKWILHMAWKHWIGKPWLFAPLQQAVVSFRSNIFLWESVVYVTCTSFFWTYNGFYFHNSTSLLQNLILHTSSRILQQILEVECQTIKSTFAADDKKHVHFFSIRGGSRRFAVDIQHHGRSLMRNVSEIIVCVSALRSVWKRSSHLTPAFSSKIK
jgi:hypothetical protein